MKQKFRFTSVLCALLAALCLLCTSCDLSAVIPPSVPTESTTAFSETDPVHSQDPSGTSDPASTDASKVTSQTTESTELQVPPSLKPGGTFDSTQIPAFSGDPFVIVNDNIPYFTDEEITAEAYEFYGDLDDLGRCTVAMACLGRELMPTEDRGSISSVQPTGWHSVSYSNISGGYLYNRCHLIGWQLTGENANRMNLITGTQFLNIEGMLPFENMLADYIIETENHVMYRVTPIFEGNDLVCIGVLMEAYSVEDNGEEIQFNVFCYNNQPGIEIDYATGDSEQVDSMGSTSEIPENATYIINVQSKKIHRLDSKYAGNLTANMEYTTLTLEELQKLGYTTCGICKPTA